MPMETSLRLLLLFIVGLSAWGLTFGRSLAWDKQRVGWLVSVVMVEEMVGLWAGMWLAREGSWYEAVALALGGGVSALLMLRRAKHG
jgi:hypothetical protein